MLKVRLKRCGRKDKPFYRIVVADSRIKRDGGVKEQLGYFDPLKHSAHLKYDRLIHYLDSGAQLTDRIYSILSLKEMVFDKRLIRDQSKNMEPTNA